MSQAIGVACGKSEIFRSKVRSERRNLSPRKRTAAAKAASVASLNRHEWNSCPSPWNLFGAHFLLGTLSGKGPAEGVPFQNTATNRSFSATSEVVPFHKSFS